MVVARPISSNRPEYIDEPLVSCLVGKFLSSDDWISSELTVNRTDTLKDCLSQIGGFRRYII